MKFKQTIEEPILFALLIGIVRLFSSILYIQVYGILFFWKKQRRLVG